MTDPTETSAGEAGGREAMSDERLAEIRADSDSGRWEFSYDGGQAVYELLAEVERMAAQRDEWHRQNGHLRGERDAATERAVKAEAQVERNKLIGQQIQQQNIQMITALQLGESRWRARAETAETELAELRERIAKHTPGPALHAWRRPDGHRVHGDEEWIRGSVERYGGTFEAAETCGYQGEWKVVDDA